MDEDILGSLNPMQRAAAERTEGPLLILAGAGSGKTRTIIHRMAHMLKSGAAKPYQILALTFTNKAAQEMRERIARFGIAGTQDMWVGTFHSIAARILRAHAPLLGYTSNFSIYDEDDVKSLITRLLKGRDLKARDVPPGAVASIISRIKESGVMPEGYTTKLGSLEDTESFFADYQKALFENNAMDFDDLLVNTLRVLEEHPDVLARYQARFTHVLVDEFQDTSSSQYRIVSLIARRLGNLCVCGDDDQSIYSWRGADVTNMLSFETDFPGAGLIRLEENYRSSANILDAANALISNNVRRKGKTLFTSAPKGEPVRVHESDRDLDEAQYIAETIRGFAREGEDYSSFAVLYRTNAQSRLIEESLARHGIPSQVIGGMRFYERMEVKDVLSYLVLAVNPRDAVAFSRACSSPRRGIGDMALSRLQEFASFKSCDLVEACFYADGIPGLTKKAREGFAAVGSVVRGIMFEPGVGEAVMIAAQKSGYMDFLADSADGRGDQRADNVRELARAGQEYTQRGGDVSLAGFLENAALVGAQDSLSDGRGAVRMMTVHNAKGLEFDTVFVSGMAEGLFPLARSSESAEGLEEERRLCYVAMTRARKRLYLTCSRFRRIYGTNEEMAERSMFLQEIPQAQEESPASPSARRFPAPQRRPSWGGAAYATPYPGAPARRGAGGAYEPGEKVTHKVFGEGVVISQEADDGEVIVLIAFAGKGVKRILDAAGVIEKLK